MKTPTLEKQKCLKCETVTGNFLTTGDNGTICQKCRDEYYFTCRECGDLFHLDFHYSCDDNDNDDFCSSCWDEVARNCETCDRVVCDSCIENHGEECGSSDAYIPHRPFSESKAYMDKKAGEIISSPRAFGVEIECYYSRAQTLFEIADRKETGEAKLPAALGITDDGSLGYKGVEFQTPKLGGKKGEKFLKDVCALLEQNNFSVRRSCGMHLHVDAKDIQKSAEWLKRIWLFYMAFDDVLLSMLPRSRRTNNFCLPLKKAYSMTDIEHAFTTEQIEELWYKLQARDEIQERKKNKWDTSRYNGINLHSLIAFGHIEIRYHSGTLNWRKIAEWANLHTRILDTMAHKENDPPIREACAVLTLSEKVSLFFHIMNLPENSESYFRERIRKFNPSVLEENNYAPQLCAV